MPTKLDNEILAAAIEGFEAQKKRLDAQIAEIRQQLRGGAGPAASPEPARKRRTMSAAGRKRVAEAQRKRWAAVRKQSGATPGPAKPEAQKPKRKLSAAGRQRIVEATQRRWALVREAAAKAAE
jgi:cell division septum initiation protein DivIVA